MTESSFCFWKCDRNTGNRFSWNVLPEFWVDSYVLMYMHYQELMKSVGSHGSLSLQFSMKVTLCEGLSQGDGCTCC